MGVPGRVNARAYPLRAALRLSRGSSFGLLTFNHMVERRSTLLDDTYAALSHAVRRDLLDELRSGPSTVTELAAPFDVSLAAVSKHIWVLENAGLVSRTQVGRTRIVTLEPRPLVDARAWIDTYRTFWEERLGALEAHLRRGRRS
jgi:DNA-binding transcriptional ArsR family regulator